MKVGVIGSGEAAKALASVFLKHAHDVVIGACDYAKLKDWAAQNSGVRVGSSGADLRKNDDIAGVPARLVRECELPVPKTIRREA
jgi:hypothetical protein